MRVCTTVAAALSASLLASFHLNAQPTTSPFGKTSPAQQAAAERSQRAKLNALRQWNNLPPRLQDQIRAQIAPLNEQQRRTLLSSIPALKSLNAEEIDSLLAELNSAVPLPSPVKLTLALNDPTSLPRVGEQATLFLRGEWDVAEGISVTNYFRVYDASTGEQVLDAVAKCPAAPNMPAAGTAIWECYRAIRVTRPNMTVYAVVDFMRGTEPLSVQSANLTITTAP